MISLSFPALFKSRQCCINPIQQKSSDSTQMAVHYSNNFRTPKFSPRYRLPTLQLSIWTQKGSGLVRTSFSLFPPDSETDSHAWSFCIQIINYKRPRQRLTTRASPVNACLGTSNPPLHLQNKVESLLDSIKWDDKGLAVAIAQNVDTGAILMQGFVNREALSKTIFSKKATFYSRSRKSLWTKGETSMNFINVCDIFIDCDRDSIVYLGKPDGPTCHTGSETCYYTSVNDVLQKPDGDANELALTTLYSLESTINKRKNEVSSGGKSSWTKRLILDRKLLCSKIREEADELCQTLHKDEGKSRTASEMADVLYHAMVLLSVTGVTMEDVLQILRLRFAQSGIEEKGSRKS